MRIVEYEAKHLNQLKKIYLETRQMTFDWMNAATFSLDDFETDTKGEQLWVAEEADSVIGFIAIWKPDNFIHHLYVAEKHQQKRVGSELLAFILEKTERPVALKCLECNKHAIRFYNKHGFIEKERGMATDGAYILMERNANE